MNCPMKREVCISFHGVHGPKFIFGQSILTLGIHLITMVGQAIPGGAAIHRPKEPYLAMVWTHFWSFMRGAIESNCANFFDMHVGVCL